MIKLNKNPFENSSTSVVLSFKDTLGKFYIPLSVDYTFLALNNDKVSWSIVDDLYKVNLAPSSQISLILNNLKLISGTTPIRKVIVNWKCLVGNELTEFSDEIRFEIQPKPYITNEPENPPTPTPIYLKVKDVNLQIGILSQTPINPVFNVFFNLPVNVENAKMIIKDEDENEIECTAYLDSTHTKAQISPNQTLEFGKTYTSILSGFVSEINSYEMENDFEFSFVTHQSGEITFESLSLEISQLTERVEVLENVTIENILERIQALEEKEYNATDPINPEDLTDDTSGDSTDSGDSNTSSDSTSDSGNDSSSSTDDTTGDSTNESSESSNEPVEG